MCPDSDLEGGQLDRRQVLGGVMAVGASAAAVGALARITELAPSSSADSAESDAVAAGAALMAASDVSVLAAGEILGSDVQAVLEELDARLGRAHVIDDLQVAVTLVDDFMGSTVSSGTIGELGWATAPGATGTVTAGVGLDDPGVVALATGTSSTGWHSINLGTKVLRGAPVLMCEQRVRVSAINDSANRFSCWFGLHTDVAGSEPTTGMYFRYSATGTGRWDAVCANGGSRTAVDTGVPVDTTFHRFRVACDGAGVVWFFIDGSLVATVTSPIPTLRHAPTFSVRKTAGTTARSLLVDYFALRYEFAR